MTGHKYLAIFFICFALISFSAKAQDSAFVENKVSDWVISDLWKFPYPAFKDQPNIKGEAFSVKKILEMPTVDIEALSLSRPREGKDFNGGTFNMKWHKYSNASNVDKVALSKTDTNEVGWVFLCTYFKNSAYENVNLSIEYSHVYELYLDGQKVLSRSEAIFDTAKIKAQEYKADLEPGFHTLLIRVLLNADHAFSVPDLNIKTGREIAIGANIPEFYDLPHYLFGESIFSPQLSSDGRYFALQHTKAKADKKGYDSWYTIGTTVDGKTVSVYQKVYSLFFAKRAPWFGYMQKNGKKTQIYMGNAGQAAMLVYETEEEVTNLVCDPSANYLILGISTSAEEGKTGLRSLCSPADQWPEYKSRTALYKLDIRGFKAKGVSLVSPAVSAVEPLTYGALSAELHDISYDGSKLLFSTEEMVDSIRDYSMQKMYVLDMRTLKTELLWTSPYFGGTAAFSPDGKTLFVSGSTALFSYDKSIDKSSLSSLSFSDKNLIINDYNHSPFVYDLSSKKPYFIGKDFAPSISSFAFEPSGEYVYIAAEDRDGVSLYTYQVGTGIGTGSPVFAKMPLSVSVLQGMDLTSDMLLYVGTSASEPVRAYIRKGLTNQFKSKKIENVLADPQSNITNKEVQVGSYIDLRFATPFGDSIDGTLYLPNGLTLNQISSQKNKYPCITYYYGGTSPTPKALAMRYPKQVWASRGYAVLVLQPSGATGYGAEFAARHVNNWGKTVADEIITAVRDACGRFSFIDSTKIGCIGASYGGFMTQLLITKTNLFAAAISHAGISSISSYWGEGYWGYIYNGVAAANAFPWNRKDIYVDQSPLFSADKIHTPLLLLHGTSDHNVPIGESYQMFKALRLLGRPVAMVTVEGEDHGIVNLPKRLEWEKTILAWFEKNLKGDSSWWNALYGEK